MRIHLAYDHNSFELGTRLADLLGSAPVGTPRAAAAGEVVRHAPAEFDDGDDYPQFALAAARAAITDQDAGVDAIGVLLGSSPAGVVIAANKVPGVRAVLGHGPDDVAAARRTDDANVVVLDHRTTSAADAVALVQLFATAEFDLTADHVRRVVQVLEFETAGTIAGWQVDYAEAVLDQPGAPGPARALVYREFGDPGVLVLEEVPEVHPGNGEVRVVVKVAGLNPIDAKLRSGRIPMPDPAFPLGTGQDLAGIVEEVGVGASYTDGTPARVGDLVLGWTDGQGAARTQLVVPAGNLARKPPALSWEVAGSLQTAGLTAQACLDVLALTAADTLLVGAAAGGVGLVAAQLALALGAQVVGTCGPDNDAALAALGVVPVRYGDGLAERVRAAVPQSVTAVLDAHGRETALVGLELGVPAPRVVVIADHAAVAELGLGSPGRYVRSAGTLAALAESAAAGRLRLPVHTFPFEDAVAAYRRLDTGHGRGKVALRL